MSRHSSMDSNQQAMRIIYNHEIPAYLLQNLRSHAMTPQYSNQSFTSTSSGSYDSNQDSYMSTSPTQYNNYDEQQSPHTHARHTNRVAGYGKDMCISPRILHPQNHFESRHSYDNHSRVVPSSDHRHIAEYEASHNRVASQRSERRQRDDDNSGTEKDNSRRIACKICHATFSRSADVKRHDASTHSIIHIDCDVHRCGRTGKNGFSRRDHLLEHKRGYHNMDIPKRHIKNNKDRQQS